jgi:hypothetical protein
VKGAVAMQREESESDESKEDSYMEGRQNQWPLEGIRTSS